MTFERYVCWKPEDLGWIAEIDVAGPNAVTAGGVAVAEEEVHAGDIDGTCNACIAAACIACVTA